MCAQVKDRFCSLLSDQVASLQDQVKQMKLDDTPEPEETSNPTNTTPGMHQQAVCVGYVPEYYIYYTYIYIYICKSENELWFCCW